MTSLTRILHVEDEPDIQEIARLALEAIGGFVVETCASGREALEKAPIFRPDLILLDVMMPGMDGPTTLRELQKIPGMTDTPIVFMTAKAQPQEIEKFKEIGATDVVSKPFDPATLSDEVRKIWERYLG